MENVDDCEPKTFSCEFYFYPRIYSDKCYFDLAWYKKVFYFIRLIWRMYFHDFKQTCLAIFLGKILPDEDYVGCRMCARARSISVLGRILVFIPLIMNYVIPFFALCLLVASFFITMHLNVIYTCLTYILSIFIVEFFLCILILSGRDFGVQKKLYACNCTLSKDIHWSTEKCKLRCLDEKDGRKFLYPGQIKEVKLDDIHD